MADLAHNPELLLSAFFRLAKAQDAPTAWLIALQAAALTGSSSNVNDVLDKLQDQYAGAVNTEGGGTTWLRTLDCILIAELCEAALTRIEADEAAEEAGGTAAPLGNLRYADFSAHPCTLG